MSAVPRLRMFAGPNGSGKSTIKSVLPPELLGVYINPDDIEREIRQRGSFDPRTFSVAATEDELTAFLSSSPLLAKAGLLDQARLLRWTDGVLNFGSVAVNSYFAAVLADFLRQKLLAQRRSFTFETVMSSPDKVSLLCRAQQLGYRTYLYYVATEDPIINVSRVAARVRRGGHPVPEDKIHSRYAASLSLLWDAIRCAHRAYLFDNSNHAHLFVAEVTNGSLLELRTDAMPAWFKSAVWDRVTVSAATPPPAADGD